jgi:hypothetical protein
MPELALPDDRSTLSALPADWASSWGYPSPFLRRQLAELRIGYEELALGITLRDEGPAFGELVTPGENAGAPVHRWFSYKEAFSHRLPRELLTRFGAGESRTVADVFGGVATTALALQSDPRVERVLSVEYSPLAHLVGSVKLRWAELSARRLRRRAAELSRYALSKGARAPDLAAFANPEIFDARVLRGLLSAREAIRTARLSSLERAFFLVGLAAVVEDLSGAMKDGRALRILRGRARRRTSLAQIGCPPAGADTVRGALDQQWAEMISDLELLGCQRSTVGVATSHLRGDARELQTLSLSGGEQAFAPESVGLFAYSPPYLNCIDYSEIYKLELWLLELVRDQSQFRDLRLGTLRSHPSVEFPARGYLHPITDTPIGAHIERIASFIERHHVRAGIGRTVRDYFDDMFRVLSQQLAALESGGFAVCVVGNSTFSRREQRGQVREEVWRIPVLTDVLLARLGLAAGFASAEIWKARDLRPRNVQAAAARESLVIFQKAGA